MSASPGPASVSAMAVSLAVATAAGVWAWKRNPGRLDLGDRSIMVGAGSTGILGGWGWRSATIVVVVPLVATMVIGERRRRRRRRRARAVEDGVVVFVDEMVQQLRSGLSLNTVCAQCRPVGPELAPILGPMIQELAQGRPLAESVDRLRARARRQTCGEMEMVATALATLDRCGGPAASALQRLRLTLIGVVQTRASARVQAAQASASASLLAMAPGLFTVVLALADAGAAHLYLQEPIGAVCVTAAIVLSYGGWWWMDRIVSRAVDEVIGLHGGKRP